MKKKTRKAQTKRAKKATYRVKNGAAYNKSLVQRGAITLWISEEVIENRHPEVEAVRPRGEQVQYSDEAIACLLLRAVYKLPYRQTEGFGQSVIDLLQADVRVPDYTTLCKRSADLAVSLPTSNPKAPKHMVVDSTGLKIYGGGNRGLLAADR